MIGHLTGYGSYLPAHRLDRQEIGRTLGTAAGHGTRVAASFDEDSTTMAVEAVRAALSNQVQTTDLYLATTSPAYLDKTNAAAVHAALGIGEAGLAADLAGSARSGVAAIRAAAASGGIAALSDVRVGLPGSADERGSADGAAALVFGVSGDAIAHLVGTASLTAEVLDRWRSPARAAAEVWEERFGFEAYAPLIRRAARTVLDDAGVTQAEHVVLVSPNAAVGKRVSTLITGSISTGGSPVGHSGAADAGLALAHILDTAGSGETILLLVAADGCDALLFRTTDLLPGRRAVRSVAGQLAAGVPVPYATYLTWRGHLTREAPRRPEPDRPAAPPSARTSAWKFGFTGSRCTACNFVQLPPARVCRRCSAVDATVEVRLADTGGRIATYTVDRLAFSPSPPLVDAVVDFDGGGRCTLEVADSDPAALTVGDRVDLVFRRLFTAGGVHNYFWKARVRPDLTSHDGSTG